MKLNENIKNNFNIYVTILLIIPFLFFYQNCRQSFTTKESIEIDSLVGSSMKNNTDDEEPAKFGQSSEVSSSSSAFLWGTEGQVGDGENFDETTEFSSALVKNTIAAINDTLRIKYVKFRIWTVSDHQLAPSYIDEVVKVFKTNGWSMVPMFTRDPGDTSVTVDEMTEYANLVVSFLDKHKSNANIQFIEQQNAPQDNWPDTSAKLLQISNTVYEKIKAKHPDVFVGTPGFEYSAADYYKNAIYNPKGDKASEQFEYFLDKKNGAKFDFWAFHGYPIWQASPGRSFHSPTRIAEGNIYAGIPGILEIRKKLNANGWQNRPMIDTEHVPIPQGPFLSNKEDALNAAYILQDLTIRRALKLENKPALAGVISLKIIARGESGERSWGSLNSDGSLSKTVKAFGLLLSKLKNYHHNSRVSGQFGDDNQAWVEKFKNKNKELYIFFKPFKDSAEKPIQLDEETLDYSLVLQKMPQSVKLTNINGSVTKLVATKTLTLSAENAPKFLEVVYKKH